MTDPRPYQMYDHSVRALKDRLGTLEYQRRMKETTLQIAEKYEEDDNAETIRLQLHELAQHIVDTEWAVALLTKEQRVRELMMTKNFSREQATDLYHREQTYERKRKENL